VRRDHLGRDRRISAVDLVPAQELLDLSPARLGELALADLAEVMRRPAAVERPLMVLPGLEALPAGIARVLRHR
jgi:hypothetical protein